MGMIIQFYAGKLRATEHLFKLTSNLLNMDFVAINKNIWNLLTRWWYDGIIFVIISKWPFWIADDMMNCSLIMTWTRSGLAPSSCPGECSAVSRWPGSLRGGSPLLGATPRHTGQTRDKIDVVTINPVTRVLCPRCGNHIPILEKNTGQLARARDKFPTFPIVSVF